ARARPRRRRRRGGFRSSRRIVAWVQISFVSIPVTDQDRAKRFYCDELGFACRADQEFAPGRRWIDVEPPGGGAGITLVTWLEGMPAGSVQGLVLAVDDIDATYAELA